MAEGIAKRHSKSCPAKGGGRCRCSGSYQACGLLPARRQEGLQDLCPRSRSEDVARRCKARPRPAASCGRQVAGRCGKRPQRGSRELRAARFATAPAAPTSPRLCAATGRRSRAGPAGVRLAKAERRHDGRPPGARRSLAGGRAGGFDDPQRDQAAAGDLSACPLA